MPSSSDHPGRGSAAVPLGRDPERAAAIEDRLQGVWALGRNLVLLWTPAGAGIDVLVIPHYAIADYATDDSAGAADRLFMEGIITGPKLATADALATAAERLGRAAVHVALPFVPGEGLSLDAVDDIVKRYSLSFVEDRAVALFDVVGFSRYAPLEQVTQLNSLAYSVNAAHSKLTDKDIDVRFARTTTGDGFYIWNRERSIDANVNLYHLMHLVMADNAIARTKAKGKTVPQLRSCFHIGGHYEFYQSEGLNPTIYSYIVGDVTIDLARMCERAKPGQVVVGDFRAPHFDPAHRTVERIDPNSFIARTQATLSSLEGLTLSGDGIEEIKCYLTGARRADGSFTVKRYRITDKHGLSRDAYNAKINIYRRSAEPIFLGLQDHELADLEVAGELVVGAQPAA